MANGKVIIGYSFPRVAKYASNEGVITYSNGMPMARGVSVNFSPENGDDSAWYADNVQAENAGSTFSGGTVTFESDSVKDAARRLLYGLPEAETLKVGGKSYQVDTYDDRQEIPYIGAGFVVKYMEQGAISYAAFVFTKLQFRNEPLEAETQGETIDFQTSNYEASIMRDDSEHHAWKKVIDNIETEAEAVAVVDHLLNIPAGA